MHELTEIVMQHLELCASSAYHHSKSGGDMQWDSPLSLWRIDWNIDVSYSILHYKGGTFLMYACVLCLACSPVSETISSHQHTLLRRRGVSLPRVRQDPNQIPTQWP
jgi:hypothetical protein